MEKIHLWQEELKLDQDVVTSTVTIEFPDGKKQQLWYSLPVKYQGDIPDHCNAFVVATLFLAMDYPAELVVHGTVDRILLQNLMEFQDAWVSWRSRYQIIEITADQEIEVSQETRDIPPNNSAITAFSGGVDSCFTLDRHTKFEVGRQRQNLTAGMMVHGFDISLDQPEVFAKALARSKVILDSVGVGLIPLVTNFRELNLDWEDAHGAAVVSCLMFLENLYPLGLVGSTLPYSSLVFPYGSNPLTDRYLSSSSFQVIHDGAGYSRVGKIKAISHWQEARENLRVCWQGAELDRNCCQCEKCIRTILSFRALGAGQPSCFPHELTNQQIEDLEIPQQFQLDAYYQPILDTAIAGGINEPWVKSLESCIHRHERGYAIKAAKMIWRQQISLMPMSIKKPLWQIRRRLIGR